MNLIYIAHTKERIWKDTYFSILTYLKYEIPSTIWLFTDNPSFFDLPNLNIIQLNKSMLEEWYGDINFVHRVKIKAIQYVGERSTENVILLDGDVLFIKNPLELFEKVDVSQSLMHKSEGRLKDFTTKSGRALNQLIATGGFLPVTSESIMYNSGVIGIAVENLPLQNEVLQLTEDLYRSKPGHIMEQLAHSVILAKHTKIIESDEYIFHWWGRGKNVEALLNPFFEKTKNKSLQEKISEAAILKKEIVKVPPNAKMSFLRKLFKKLGLP